MADDPALERLARLGKPRTGCRGAWYGATQLRCPDQSECVVAKVKPDTERLTPDVRLDDGPGDHGSQRKPGLRQSPFIFGPKPVPRRKLGHGCKTTGAEWSSRVKAAAGDGAEWLRLRREPTARSSARVQLSCLPAFLIALGSKAVAALLRLPGLIWVFAGL